MDSHSDIALIEKRLENAVREIRNMTAQVGQAKQVRDYDSDRRKTLLAQCMLPYLKAGHSAASAEMEARADPVYEMKLNGLATQREAGELSIAKWDAAFCTYEWSLQPFKYGQDNPEYTGMSVSPKDVAWLLNSTVDDLEACMKENDKLREQLAAEREKSDSFYADLMESREKVEHAEWSRDDALAQLDKVVLQLAAERSKHTIEVQKLYAEITNLQEVRQRLMAKVAKLHTKMEAHGIQC